MENRPPGLSFSLFTFSHPLQARRATGVGMARRARCTAAGPRVLRAKRPAGRAALPGIGDGAAGKFESCAILLLQHCMGSDTIDRVFSALDLHCGKVNGRAGCVEVIV